MPAHSNLTTDEAADYLRVSWRTLIRWRNARIGPAWIKIGQRVIYRQGDLDAWLNAHRVHPVRETALAHANHATKDRT